MSGRRALGVFTASMLIVALNVHGSTAFASFPSTNWTGGGTPSGGGLSWSDPANWDNGVPAFGSVVTIAPSVPTHVTDVPSIRLSELHLNGTGDVPYDLSSSTPDSMVEVWSRLEWRSGTLDLGIVLIPLSGSSTSLASSTDTHDAVVIDGALWVEGTCSVSVRGAHLPSGAVDANVRLGPIATGNSYWGGVFNAQGLTMSDGSIIASENAADPGLFKPGSGDLAAIGPESGDVALGARILDLQVRTGGFPSSAWTTPPAPGASTAGMLIFEDDDIHVYQDEWIRGNGVVVIGSGSTLHDFRSLVISNNATLRLGEGWSDLPATIGGGQVEKWGGNPDVQWRNAVINGALHVTSPFGIVGGDTVDVHRLNGSLRFDAPDATLLLGGPVELGPGASLDATSLQVTGDGHTSVIGDASTKVNLDSIAFADPRGDSLEMGSSGITLGSVNLGANELVLGQDAVLSAPWPFRLGTSILGPKPGDVGTIVAAPGTSGQQVSMTGEIHANLDPSFTPQPGDRFDAVSVPGGSVTESMVLSPSGSLTPWQVESTPTSLGVSYVAWAQLHATGEAPEKVPVASQFSDVLTVINYGPNATKHARIGISVPPGLQVLRVTTNVGTCTHGDSQIRCSIGRIEVYPAEVHVHVRFMAWIKGTFRVRTRVFDTWTTDDSTGDNRPRMITRVG